MTEKTIPPPSLSLSNDEISVRLNMLCLQFGMFFPCGCYFEIINYKAFYSVDEYHKIGVNDREF